MHKPIADEFESIAARLKEIEQGKQAEREKPAEAETPTAPAPAPDTFADYGEWIC